MISSTWPTITASAAAMQWRNHIRLHLTEPKNRTEELTGILTTSQYVQLVDVNVVQQRFYREQINGVVYFRQKGFPVNIIEPLYRFEVSFFYRDSYGEYIFHFECSRST